MRFAFHRAPCLVLLALLACAGPPNAGPDDGEISEDPLFDPQLLVLDLASPSTRLDGRGGSMLPGKGWAPAQAEILDGEETFIAWIVDGLATLWFEAPEAGPLDLWARCRPFTWDDAPEQIVTVEVEGRALAEHHLAPGWREMRIALPAGAFEPGLNSLALRFAYAERPSDVTPELTPDDRRLSAACAALALIPHRVPDADAFLAATSLDARNRRLRLAAGAQIAWPLPAATEIRLRLVPRRQDCEDCKLRIDLVGRDGTRLLWSESVAGSGPLDLRFTTAAGAPSHLRLGLVPAAGQPPGHRQSLELEMPEPFLTVESRGPGPGDASGASPHLFVYLIDTLRADFSTLEGELSPNLAALARDAVTYRQAWSPSAWTLPSVVSLMTGVYPHRHGILRGDTRYQGEHLPSLATRLSEVGYETLGLSQSLVASKRFGLDHGFERFFLSNQLNNRALRSQELRRALLLHLLHRERPERPVFAYLHSVDPHAPYAPTGEDRRFAGAAPGTLPAGKYLPHVFMAESLGDRADDVAHLRALYRGEAGYADRQLGRFLDLLRHLGLYENSLIAVVSDHGEEFGEHKGFGHGRTMYEEMLRVPLLVKYPGGRWAGTAIDRRVSTLDLTPTLLAEAGIDTSRLLLDGALLHPPEIEARPRSRRLVFSEVHPGRAPHAEAVRYRALGLGDLKCIESLDGFDQFGNEIPRLQAFDLATDPGEQQPLTGDTAEAVRCRSLLDQWTARREQLPASADPGPATDDETLEKLRALGYID